MSRTAHVPLASTAPAGPQVGKRALLVLGLAGATGLAISQSASRPDPARFNGFDLSGALIPVDAIERGGPPRDGIPAIDTPRFVPASRSSLRDADRVLGLSHKGVVRAYPVRILNWHEVVNDQPAGDVIAVTYCPLCGTGMAFDARLQSPAGARELSFGISGLLFNSDVLLYDRGTQSLWSQLRQQAISGPLKGTQLKAVPLEHTTWSDWRRRFPATEVLSFATGFARDYGRDPYAGYENVNRLMFQVQHHDARLGLKEWVLGLSVGTARKAYPFSTLAARVGKDGVLEDRLGGQVVRIRYDAQHRTARAEDGAGKPLPSVLVFWFAWVAFHPQTELLT
ncbi:DUF3179 domain-containing protein [Polaromonas sp.]|uniref:DUF3179 domain-containing protein n=1 Tax=Polaromonas sp. TaxID=1869339 RepID=UPI003561E7DC